jgi:hypothetical protein
MVEAADVVEMAGQVIREEQAPTFTLWDLSKAPWPATASSLTIGAARRAFMEALALGRAGRTREGGNGHPPCHSDAPYGIAERKVQMAKTK